MRGENFVDDGGVYRFNGTSPRARGKLPAYPLAYRTRRNIPACAGKTQSARLGWCNATEHPRVRGENSKGTRWASQWIGTSPRARGKRSYTDSLRLQTRNIPACAGKTLIDVRFLVPDGHFTFGFVFLHRGGSMESPCSFLLSECFSVRIVVYGRPGTNLLSAFDCAFWRGGG